MTISKELPPSPLLERTIAISSLADSEGLQSGLVKVADGHPLFRFEPVTETGVTRIGGISFLGLSVLVAHIQASCKHPLELGPYSVVYRRRAADGTFSVVTNQEIVAANSALNRDGRVDQSPVVAGPMVASPVVVGPTDILFEPIMQLDLDFPDYCLNQIEYRLADRRLVIKSIVDLDLESGDYYDTPATQGMTAEIPLAELEDFREVISPLVERNPRFSISFAFLREVPAGQELLIPF